MAFRTTIHIRALVFASVILLCFYVGPKQHSQLHNRRKRALLMGSAYSIEDSPSSPVALRVESTFNVLAREVNSAISLSNEVENQSPKSLRKSQLFTKENYPKKHYLVSNKSLQKTVISNRHLNNSLRESNLKQLINTSIQHLPPRYTSTSYSNSSSTIKRNTKDSLYRLNKRKIRSNHIPKYSYSSNSKPNRHVYNSVIFDTKSIVVKLRASTLLRKNIIALLGSMLFNSKTIISEELYISLLNIYDALRMRRLHTLDFIHILAEIVHKPLQTQFSVFFHELEKHSPEYLKWDVIAWRAATFGNMSNVKELVTLELSKQHIDFLSGIDETDINILQNHTVFTQSTVDGSLDWVVSITGNFYANIIGIITEGNLIMTKELFVYVMLQLPCETFSPELEETRIYIADVLLNEENYHIKVKYTRIQTKSEPDPYKLIQSVLTQIKIQITKQKAFEELLRSINILISYMAPPRIPNKIEGTEYSFNELTVNYTEAFNIVTPSEFPVDVVQCKNDILLFIQDSPLHISSIMKMSEMYKIKSSKELLIELLSKFRRNLNVSPNLSSCINTLRSHIMGKYNLWEKYSFTNSNYNRKSLILEAFQSPYLPKNAYNVTSYIISKLDREYPNWQNESDDVTFQTPPRYYFLKLALSIDMNKNYSGWNNIQASLNDFIDYFNTLQTIHIQCKNECSTAVGRSLPLPSGVIHGVYKSNNITEKTNSLYDATTVPAKISTYFHKLNISYTQNSTDELEENFLPSVTDAIETRRQPPTENQFKMKEIYYDPSYLHSSVYFTKEMPTSYQFDQGNWKFHTSQKSNRVMKSSSISANNVETYPPSPREPRFSMSNEEINQENTVITDIPRKGLTSHFVPTALYEDPNHISNTFTEESARTDSSQPPQKFEINLRNETYIISFGNETLKTGAINLSRKLCEFTQKCFTSNLDELNGGIKLCNYHFKERMLDRPSSTYIKKLLQSLPNISQGDKLHIFEMFLNSPNISQILGDNFIMTNFPSLNQLMFGLLKHSLSLSYIKSKPELYDVLKYFDKALTEELDKSQDTKENKIVTQNMHTESYDIDSKNNVNAGYNFLNLNDFQFDNSLLMFNLPNNTDPQQLNKLITFLDTINMSDSMTSCCNIYPEFIFKTILLCIINRSLTLDSDKITQEHLKTLDYFHKLLDSDSYTNYSKTLTNTDVVSLLSELPSSSDSKKYMAVISLLLNPYFINVLGTSFNVSLYNSTKDLLRAVINHCLSLRSLQSDPNLIEALHFCDNILQDSAFNMKENMLFDKSPAARNGNTLLEPDLNYISQMNRTISEFELKGILKQAHEMLSAGNNSELQETIKYYYEMLELQGGKQQECVTKLLNETSLPSLTGTNYKHLLQELFLEAIRMKYVKGYSELLNNLYECRMNLNSSFLTNLESELPAMANNSAFSNANLSLSEEITTLPSLLNTQVQSNFSFNSGKYFDVTQYNTKNDFMKGTVSHSSAEDAVVSNYSSSKLSERFKLFDSKAITLMVTVPENLSQWSDLEDNNLTNNSRHLKHHKTTSVIPDNSSEKYVAKLKDKQEHYKYINEKVSHKDANASLNTVSGQSLTTLENHSEVFTTMTEAIGPSGRNSELKPGKKIKEETYSTEHDLSNSLNFKASNNEKTLKLEKIVDDKDIHDTPLYNRSSLHEVHNGAGLDKNAFPEFETDNKIDKKKNLYRTSFTPRTKQDHLYPFTFRTIVQNISSNYMEKGMQINLLFQQSPRLLGSKYINKHQKKPYIFNKQTPTHYLVNKLRENNDTFRKSNHSTMLPSNGGANTTANAKTGTTNKILVEPIPFDDISKKWYNKGPVDNETSETSIEIKAYSDGNRADNQLHTAETQMLSPHKNFTGTDQYQSEIIYNNLSSYSFSELPTPYDMLSEQRNTGFETDFSQLSYNEAQVLMDLTYDRNVLNTNNFSVNSRFQEHESGIGSNMVSQNDISGPNVNNNMTIYLDYVNNSHNSPLMQSVDFDSNNLKTDIIRGMNSSLNYFENRHVDVNFTIRMDEIEHISTSQNIKYSGMSDNVNLSRMNIDETKISKGGLNIGQSEPNATELYTVTYSFPNMEQQSTGLYGLNLSLRLRSTQSNAQHDARIIETTTNTQEANNDYHSTERNELDFGLKNLFSSLNPRHTTTTQIFTTPLSTSHNEISMSRMTSKLLSQDSNEYQAKNYFTGIINTTSNENLFDDIAYNIQEKGVAAVDDKEHVLNQSTSYENETSSLESEINTTSETFVRSHSKNISYSNETEHVPHDHKYTNVKFPDRDALLCLNSTAENCKHNYSEKETFYNENNKSYTYSTTDNISPYALYNDTTGETAIVSDFISLRFTSHRPNPVERSNLEGILSLDSESKEAVDHNMLSNISATENAYYNNQGSTKIENLSDTISSRKSLMITSSSNYTTPRLHKMKKIGAKPKHSKANSSIMRKYDNDTEDVPALILYHLYIHGSKIMRKQHQNRSSSPATTASIKGKSREESNISEIFEKESENNHHKMSYFTTKVVDTDILNDTQKRPTYIGTTSNSTDETREIHNETYDRFNEINSTLNNDTDDVLAAAKVSFDQRYQEGSNVIHLRNEGKENNESNKDDTIQQTVSNRFYDSSVQYNKQHQGNGNNYTEKSSYIKSIENNEILDNTPTNVSKSKNSSINYFQSSNSTSHQMMPYNDTNFESFPGNVSSHRLTTEVTANIQDISGASAFNSNFTSLIKARTVPTTNLLTEMSKVNILSSLKPTEADDDILNSLNADKLNFLGTNEFWVSNSESYRSDYQFSTSVTHYDDEELAQIRNVSLVLREILKTPEGHRLKILMNFLRKPDLVQSLGPSFNVVNFPNFRLLLQGIIARALEVISIQDDVKLMETLKYYKKLLEN